MGYEIDFLRVGEGERGGDAITFRLGNMNGARTEQFVGIIDGGTKDAGERVVEHIKKYYGTEEVDLVVSTHPDSDHSSGLTEVLEKMKVRYLWMHRPWEHAEDIRNLFKDGRITDSGLEDKIKKSLESAYELEAIAKRKKIPIIEPFSDTFVADNKIIVLGPSEEFYQSLLPYFRGTPVPKEGAGLFERVTTAAIEGIKWIAETWGIETLSDPEEDETSAENNSSVILLLKTEERNFLFTSDAGSLALSKAIEKAEVLGIDLTRVQDIQIPHHGSKHNVGPTILNVILGPKREAKETIKRAAVSIPKDGAPKHPSKKVTNAFKRRGAEVFATEKDAFYFYSKDAPSRGWDKAEPLPFYDVVEE